MTASLMPSFGLPSLRSGSLGSLGSLGPLGPLGSFSACGPCDSLDSFDSLAAALLLTALAFGPFEGIPSPSAASGSPGMSLRLCTSTRRASLNVISTLLSDMSSETNPFPNFGCVTMVFSV